MAKKITQGRLKEVLYYDPDTGAFTWKITKSSLATKGKTAGTLSPGGYRSIQVDGKHYQASALANLYIEGFLPEHEMDHINRDRDNNKWKNIRHVSHSCNVRNRGMQKNNTSGVTGVRWVQRRSAWYSWIATKHLGSFKHKTAAVLKRWEAEVELGFPDCQTSSSSFLYLQAKDLV